MSIIVRPGAEGAACLDTAVKQHIVRYGLSATIGSVYSWTNDNTTIRCLFAGLRVVNSLFITIFNSNFNVVMMNGLLE